MNTIAESPAAQPSKRMPTWAIILITMVLTALATTLVIRYYFFPGPFSAVELSTREEQKLDQKLATLIPGYTRTLPDGEVLEPEPYSEEGANRELEFNEREVNAILARNTDLGEKLAIDLAQDLVSAKLLIHLEPGFPIMGGKTVRINAGMKLAYAEGKPMAVLKGVSIMGVPVPNAWLGNLKNIDLVQQFGGQDGFWKSFAAGVEYLQVQDGHLHVKLKE